MSDRPYQSYESALDSCKRNLDVLRNDFLNPYLHQVDHLTNMYEEDLTIEGKRKRAEKILLAFWEGCRIAIRAAYGGFEEIPDDPLCRFRAEDWRHRYNQYLESRYRINNPFKSKEEEERKI